MRHQQAQGSGAREQEPWRCQQSELIGRALSGRDGSREKKGGGVSKEEEEIVALRCGLWKTRVHVFFSKGHTGKKAI